MKYVPENYSFVFATVNGKNKHEMITNGAEWLMYWLKFKNMSGEKGTVVFDIDDTLVDNEEKNIVPIQKVYNLCLMLNIVVNIVTARPESKHNRLQTQTMLAKNGFRVYEALYMMPAGIAPSYESISQYKYTARSDIAKRHPILANVGDMWTDHVRLPTHNAELSSMYERKIEECAILFPPKNTFPSLKLPGTFE